MIQFAMPLDTDNFLFFCFVAASAAAGFGFGLFSLYRRLARHRRRRRPGEAQVIPAGDPEDDRRPPSVAAGLPAFMYSRLVRHSGKGGASWTECAVCLGAIHAGAMVKLLPACAHVYHVDCIDLWLSSRSTCPLCRCSVADQSGAGEEAALQLAQVPPA